MAVFLSYNEAGSQNGYDDAVRKYIDPIREGHPEIKLVSIEGFGGRIKIFGRTTVDSHDPEKAGYWAESLGEALLK